VTAPTERAGASGACGSAAPLENPCRPVATTADNRPPVQEWRCPACPIKNLEPGRLGYVRPVPGALYATKCRKCGAEVAYEVP
jgi:hypothetical protein